MFHGKTVGTKMVRRLTAAAMVGGLLLTIAAAPASAKSLIGGGVMWAQVVCSMGTRTADVTVNVSMPDGYPNGLYFYTQIWARARGASTWTFVNHATSDRLFTWTSSSTFSHLGVTLTRNSYVLATGRFSGAGYQEVHVRWKYAVPGGYWSAWNLQSFNVPGDPDSSIYQAGSYLGGYTTTCSL